MPHKTLIGVYLFIIIFDKNINQTLCGGHFVFEIEKLPVAFDFTISDNLCTPNSGLLLANLICFVKSWYIYFFILLFGLVDFPWMFHIN